MQVEFWVEELDELVERGELGAHAGLVAHEVAGHAPHEAGEGPEGKGVVLEDGVDGGQEVGHALDVAEVLGVRIRGVGAGGGGGFVVFEVGKEHIFELFEVHVCAVAAGDIKGRGRIRVGDVIASEEWDMAVCAVDVFFYGADSEVSKLSDAAHEETDGRSIVMEKLKIVILPIRPFCSFHHSSSSGVASPSTILSHQAPFSRMN